MQAIYIREFLFSDSSTPNTFAVFTFYEQKPNFNDCQKDYLICHLLQVEGKKMVDEIKASLKQSVHIPTNFNELGTEIQLFTVTTSIFFGEESICTTSLQQLLIMIGRNMKSFRDQIILDEFFSARFLFAVDKQVQCWLKMCKLTQNS
jgi:hypothetical protein